MLKRVMFTCSLGVNPRPEIRKLRPVPSGPAPVLLEIVIDGFVGGQPTSTNVKITATAARNVARVGSKGNPDLIIFGSGSWTDTTDDFIGEYWSADTLWPSYFRLRHKSLQKRPIRTLVVASASPFRRPNGFTLSSRRHEVLRPSLTHVFLRARGGSAAEPRQQPPACSCVVLGRRFGRGDYEGSGPGQIFLVNVRI